MTAAIGMPKITPGMPAIRPPISTDPRTTIGWIPTAPCMIRGWSTFITTNQPAAIRAVTGSSASGLKRRATITGGIHATNGPKNGIAMRMPAAAAVTPTSGNPNTTLVTSAMRKYVRPMIDWPRRNPPNERETDVCRRRASSA